MSLARAARRPWRREVLAYALAAAIAVTVLLLSLRNGDSVNEAPDPTPPAVPEMNP